MLYGGEIITMSQLQVGDRVQTGSFSVVIFKLQVQEGMGMKSV